MSVEPCCQMPITTHLPLDQVTATTDLLLLVSAPLTTSPSRSFFKHHSTLCLFTQHHSVHEYSITNMADNSHSMSSNVLPVADRPEMYGFIWCSGLFCVLVAIWTGLRIYARTLRQMPLGIEDLLYHISVVSLPFAPIPPLLFFFGGGGVGDGLLEGVDFFLARSLTSTYSSSFADCLLRLHCGLVHGNPSRRSGLPHEPAEQVPRRPVDTGAARLLTRILSCV